MKNFMFLIFIIMPSLCFGSVTAQYVPHAKSGQSTTTLENGSIIDLGTASGFGNVGIGSISPGQALDVNGTVRILGGGVIKDVGIGTTTNQELCRKFDGTFGYFNGVWAGTCN